MDLPFDAPLRLPHGRAAGPWHARAPAAMALIGGLALLLSFQHVVRGAVSQGDQRRQATAAHADATWRCRDLRPTSARVQCLERLGPAP
jgi:hypothetical protein